MAHFIALAEVRKQCSLPGNPRNRLVEITDAERTTALYGHNYKGQRVTKAMGQRAQHFIYNQFNQLIAEANDQGVIEKEYVYLGLTPIAHIQVADEAVYYHHNDHLGSVQAISDAQQNILWRAHYKPFGAIEQVEGQGENNWRFPGQYADQESGYYYNYFRDYDPSLGRYLQSDPIGLKGGVNTFGYVLGNPVGSIDPLGLRPPEGDYLSYQEMRSNIATAKNMNALEFANAVKPHGVWDFKNQVLQNALLPDGSLQRTWEAFGNYHYGVTGRAAGFTTAELLSAGSIVQVLTHPIEFLSGDMSYVPLAGYDDPADAFWVKQGADDFDKGRYNSVFGPKKDNGFLQCY